MSLTDILSWATVAVGLLLSIKGVQATLYFRHRLKLLEGNWVMLVTFRTVLTITIGCLVLTLARIYTLTFGPAPWTPVIGGIAVIWILSIPWLKLAAYQAHEE